MLRASHSVLQGTGAPTDGPILLVPAQRGPKRASLSVDRKGGSQGAHPVLVMVLPTPALSPAFTF